MLTVAEAEAAVVEAMPRYPSVTLPLSRCLGRILREPIRSDRPQPPFHRVAMDGIALSHAALAKGLRRFAVEGRCKAGDPGARLSSPEGCLEVMTGAVLPEGADCVIPVELLAFSGGVAVVEEAAAESLRPWKHVHRQGSDCAAGENVAPAGTLLAPPHLGAAAAFGAMTLEVAYAPSVAVIATGDELVDPAIRPARHQTRRSNPFAVEAALRRLRIEKAALLHSRDQPLSLRRCVEGVLGKCDVLILTGGVSMGKTDYVPAALVEAGIQPLFHKVLQKPGKPFWFGIAGPGGGGGTPVFALPGNPASVLVCLYRYVLPALARAMGGEAAVMPEPVILAEGAPAPGTLAQFRPVTLRHDAGGKVLADWVGNQGSGDFSGWSKSDGFVELASGEESLQPGAVVPFRRW